MIKSISINKLILSNRNYLVKFLFFLNKKRSLTFIHKSKIKRKNSDNFLSAIHQAMIMPNQIDLILVDKITDKKRLVPEIILYLKTLKINGIIIFYSVSNLIMRDFEIELKNIADSDTYIKLISHVGESKTNVIFQKTNFHLNNKYFIAKLNQLAKNSSSTDSSLKIEGYRVTLDKLQFWS